MIPRPDWRSCLYVHFFCLAVSASVAGAEAAPGGGRLDPVTDLPPQQDSTCLLHKDLEFVGLDWARRKTYQGVCVSARWFDGLWGEDAYDTAENPIEGYLGFDFERRSGAQLTLAPRIRMRLKLPNMSRRLDLFFERDDENKTIVGQTDSTVTRQLGAGGKDVPQVGIGYELMRSVNELVNFRAGVRVVHSRVDPFVRSRYSLEFAKTARSEWRLGETLFWRQADGFGETTAIDYENRIGGPFILHWSNSATLSQVTTAFLWGSTVSVLQPLDEKKTLNYSYSASGETGQDVVLTRFGPRVGFRRKLHRRWLFGEIYVGVERAKTLPDETRTEIPYVGIKLEAHFKSD